MSKEKKCDNCQQSNNEGYYQIKVKGGNKVLNFCKECINCHDCKKKEGEGLWNDKLYLCKTCMNKRQKDGKNENKHDEPNERTRDLKCNHCQQPIPSGKTFIQGCFESGGIGLHPDQWHENCWPAVEKEQRQKDFVPGSLTQNYYLWIHESGSKQEKHWLYNYKTQKWEVLAFEIPKEVQWGSKSMERLLKNAKSIQGIISPLMIAERERERERANSTTNTGIGGHNQSNTPTRTGIKYP